jgi:hypothetical protein
MARYVVGPKRTAEDDFYDKPTPMPPIGHPQVFVSEPIKTGIIDLEGRDLYRLPDEIGFLRKDKR